MQSDSLIKIAVDYYKDDGVKAGKALFYYGKVAALQDNDTLAIQAYLSALAKLEKTEEYKLQGFVHEYIGVLNGSGLSAAYIKLELTESAFFENISIMNNVIEALHKVGIKVLMDDFGTGYSSMMMLKNVAIDVLKLDKSFVDDIGDDRSEKIISNIIYLAHSLQIEVTAEGVETAAQFEFLKSVGCDYIQGYYFGKPQPAEDFAALLQKEFYDGSDAGADKKG